MAREVKRLTIAGALVEFETWGTAEPAIVFVHDGLGSIAQWGDVPTRVASESGMGVFAYNRAGHGGSTPVAAGRHPPNWMSTEAGALADVIELAASGPVRLVGHSDGGSIALLCAMTRPDLVRDVVVLAAHSWVEPKCVSAITALRRDPGALIAALGRYHAHPAALFERWSGGWTNPEFASWDIRPQLAELALPTLVVQGDCDEYATDEMLWSTVAALGTSATAHLLVGCRHAVHRDRPDEVVRMAAGKW